MNTRRLLAPLGAPAVAMMLLFCGCGDNDKPAGRGFGSGFWPWRSFEPMAGQDTSVALGVNLDKEMATRIAESYIERIFSMFGADGKTAAEAKSKLDAFVKDPLKDAPRSFREFLEESGLRHADLRWAVLTVSGPLRTVDDYPQLGGLSIALAGDVNLDKAVSAVKNWLAEHPGIAVSLREEEVEGEKAWRVIFRDNDFTARDIDRFGIDPHIASLDGRLVLVSMSRRTLARQIRLYRNNEDKGDALRGFSADGGDFAHLHVACVGDIVRQNVERRQLRMLSQVLPNGEEVALGLKSLDIDIKAHPDGTSDQSVVLEVASEGEADQLRTMAKAGLLAAKAHIASDPCAPRGLGKLLDAMEIGGTNGRIEILHTDIVSALAAAVIPPITSAMDNARTLAISRNASALFMAITAASLDRGAKGLDTAWPHTEVDEGADSDDIAGKAYKSATEYFNDLLDIGNLGGPQHRPYIDVAGVEVLGKNAVLNGSVNSAGLDWCIAANIDEDMPDNIPVIVSANFNPALLLSKWDGRSNRSTLLPIGPKSGAERSMFGDKSIIVVYKNGSRKTIKSGSLDYGTLYGQTQFDLTESRHPLVYLTPTGIAEPKGGHPAGNRAAGKNVSTDKNTPVSKRPEERYNAEAELKKALDELDSLSGQDGVKAEVKRIVNKEKTNAARRAQGLPVALHSLQMIFSGNPGTGKAAVAHIVARIFRALGVVEKGQLVKTDRSGMVGGHMGETAKKTAAVCDKAIGGVLFIDNANELCNSDGDDYGREAIATLLKHMEDNRGKMVVIIAGRKDKMLDLLRTYPGLESRFLAKIEFADAPIMD